MPFILAPYKNALKRNIVRIFMENHSFNRKESRAAYSQMKDEHVEQANRENGVNLVGFDFSSIVQWVKDNWKTILKVAMSIVGILLMFIMLPPQAINIPTGRMAGDSALPDPVSAPLGQGTSEDTKSGDSVRAEI